MKQEVRLAIYEMRNVPIMLLCFEYARGFDRIVNAFLAIR